MLLGLIDPEVLDRVKLRLGLTELLTGSDTAAKAAAVVSKIKPTCGGLNDPCEALKWVEAARV